MEIFVDSANIEEIEKVASQHIVDGVTTNPTLIKGSGKSHKSVIEEISQIVSGPISVETTANTWEKIVEQANEFITWGNNIVIKVVLNQQGLYAVKKLAEQNIQTNVTLVFSTMQALLAAKAGATYVSPFLGRVDDIGSSGIELIENIRTVFENYDLGTKILSASIRHTQHVQDVALAGTDCITMPPKLFDALLKHPLTDLGIKQFEKDAAVFENA